MASPTWNKPPKTTTTKTPTTHMTEDIQLIFEEEAGQTNNEALERIKSQAVRDIFGPGANPNRRYVADYEQIAQYSDFLKGLGLRVVYTPGVWDLPHIGHCRYLQKAKQLGDILIVGTELDSAISIRKGPNRPVVPFNERVEMLCHIRHVDLVVPIPDFDDRGLSGMKMVEAIKPNVFVVSKRSFREADDTDDWVGRVKDYCEHVEVLESMAETSTSAKIRGLVMDLGEYAKNALNEAQLSAIKTVEQAFEEVKQRIDEVVRKA
jgi:D-beta-D-heptose 7-phosphate kinase/D-beta-D-heptose 1-phosphate adenosyltransferase